MIGKVFTVVKSHPKKIVFFSSALGLGANYFYRKHEDKLLFGAYCVDALKYGEDLMSADSKDRNITVILNPTANNGKCKARYNKYCAPLLHLAGLRVSFIRTEHEGQAKEIADHIAAGCNGIVIAGGDGLVSEVITGLLRGKDAQSEMIPIAIIPLGNRNTTASAIWGFRGKTGTREIADATMAVVREEKTKLDVMEVTQLEGDADAKPVYAATGLEWGALREARERRDRYWYWGPLKKYVTYIFSSYKDLTWNCDADVEWSLPCSGCNRCVTEVSVPTVEASRRWWHAFMPRKPSAEGKKIDYSQIVNDDCGKMHSDVLNNISDLRITTRNTHLTKDIPGNALALRIGPKNVGFRDFFRAGWNEENYQEPNHTVQTVGSIVLKPTITNDEITNSKREYGIDGESFDIRSVRIRALPNAVPIFGPNK